MRWSGKGSRIATESIRSKGLPTARRNASDPTQLEGNRESPMGKELAGAHTVREMGKKRTRIDPIGFRTRKNRTRSYERVSLMSHLCNRAKIYYSRQWLVGRAWKTSIRKASWDVYGRPCFACATYQACQSVVGNREGAILLPLLYYIMLSYIILNYIALY